MADKALVLCSGGLDSTTLLALMIARYGEHRVEALSLFYGQRHDRELISARAIADHYRISLHMLDLATIFAQSNSSLLSTSTESIPKGSYAHQRNTQSSELISTYVPFRNGLFLSAAASLALSRDCTVLAYGAHHDDWADNAYPDCSAEFVENIGKAISIGSGGILRLDAPFVTWNKSQIVAKGLELGVPYELTWSCYEGGSEPCGQCATCIDRARAFALNGASDPLLSR